MILNQVFIIFLSCFYFMFSCFRFPCVLVLKMTVIKPVRTAGTIARSYQWPSKVLIILVCFRVVSTTGQYGLLDCGSSRQRKRGRKSIMVRPVGTVCSTVPVLVDGNSVREEFGTTDQYGLRNRTTDRRREISS